MCLLSTSLHLFAHMPPPQVLHSDAIFAAEACLRRHGSKQIIGRGGVAVHLSGWLEDRE